MPILHKLSLQWQRSTSSGMHDLHVSLPVEVLKALMKDGSSCRYTTLIHVPLCYGCH